MKSVQWFIPIIMIQRHNCETKFFEMTYSALTQALEFMLGIRFELGLKLPVMARLSVFKVEMVTPYSRALL